MSFVFAWDIEQKGAGRCRRVVFGVALARGGRGVMSVGGTGADTELTGSWRSGRQPLRWSAHAPCVCTVYIFELTLCGVTL